MTDSNGSLKQPESSTVQPLQEKSLKQILSKGIVSQIFKKRKASQKVLEDAERPLQVYETKYKYERYTDRVKELMHH